jgi:hypothetical protein
LERLALTRMASRTWEVRQQRRGINMQDGSGKRRDNQKQAGEYVTRFSPCFRFNTSFN